MRRAATYCPSSGAFNSAKLQFPAVPTHYLRPWRRSKKKHDTTCPVNYSGRSKNTYLTEKKVRNDLAKKKMDSDMQKLPLMSHGGPGHVPRAGLYWHNLLAGRSAGWLASASRPLASARRPHLLIEDALLLGLRFGPLTTFLAALLACLLTCVRVAWFTPPY